MVWVATTSLSRKRKRNLRIEVRWARRECGSVEKTTLSLDFEQGMCVHATNHPTRNLASFKAARPLALALDYHAARNPVESVVQLGQ